MSQAPNNMLPYPNPPIPQAPPPRRRPQWFADLAGSYVRVLLAILLWGVVAAAGIAFAGVSLICIWYAARVVLSAIGVQIR